MNIRDHVGTNSEGDQRSSWRKRMLSYRFYTSGFIAGTSCSFSVYARYLSDFVPQYYRGYVESSQTDLRAIFSDWEATGGDLEGARQKFEREYVR